MNVPRTIARPDPRPTTSRGALRPGVVLIALAAALALPAGCGATEARSAEGGEGPAPALVRVAEVRGGTLEDTRTYLGQVRPMRRVVLAAAVPGIVSSVAVRQGDRVTAGQEVVVLDRALVEREIAASEAERSQVAAELREARSVLRRGRRLAEAPPPRQGGLPVMPEAELERYEADVQSLRARRKAAAARIALAEVERERHVVAAPFDGVIVAREVEPGGWVQTGAPLLSLVSADEVEVFVDVPPSLRDHVARGTAAALRRGDAEAPATVTGALPSLDERARLMRVVLTPSGPAPWLLPGMTVDVAFTVRVDEDGVVVPRDALVRGPAGDRVVRVGADDTAEPVAVTLVASAGAEALVRGEGLAAGDRLVVRGNERVRPGQPLRIEEATP